MIDLQSIFPNSVNPDSISVYLGRVISLDENFQDNGYLYVDLVDPNSKDLDKGEKTANRAKASFALRTCHNSWEKPPEIKSKTQFMGSMSMTTNGDFHLKNYCFDMQTMTWFMTVSTALNAIGIVNVPPVLVGLDTTPFPGKAVAVNVSLAAKEVVEEAIDDSLRDLTASNSGSSSSNRSTRRSVGSSSVKPNLQIVKQKLAQKNSGVQLRNTRSNDTNDVIADIIHKITDPIQGILDKAFAPYYQFINCINLLFQIYEKQLDAIEEITWPITTFSNISSATGLSSGSDIATKLALKNKLKSKIKDFSDSIPNPKDLIPSDMLDTVYSALYEPLNYMYQTVSDTIDDIVNPIKNKITGIITTYVKEPLSTLISFISMAIQPAISSLPSFIQVIVKLALKKLLKVLLGTPIKFILSKVISPIEKLIDKAAKAMKNKVMEVFSSAINAVIKPLIKPIQTAITEMIPSFDMDYIEKRLTDIRYGVEEFPDIYVGVDPLHPYKKFVDINWSDSNEVACMIHSLIEDAGIPTSYTPSVIELTKVVESISFQDDSSPTPPKDPEDGPDAPKISDDPDPVPEEDPNPTYILKKFESKEEFMPFFIQMHPPVMIDAKLGEGMFEKYGYGENKIKPETWITNGVDYVTDDAGEKYVVTMESGVEVSVFYPESEEIGIVKLEKDYVYESEEVQHITEKNDKDTPVEGNDLVPQVHLYVGSLTPNKLQIQKMNDKEELLYWSDSNKTIEDTYDNIVKRYLEDKIETESLDKALLSESVFDVNSFVDTVNDHWDLSSIKNTALVKFLCNVTAWSPSTVEANNYYWFADNDSVDHHYQGDKNNIIYINRNRKTDDGVVCDVPPIKPVHFSVSLETPDTNTRKIIITNGNSVPQISDYTNLAVKYEITLTKDSENKYKTPVLVTQMVKVTATETTPPVLQYEWSTADQTYSDLTAPVFALSYTKQTKDPESLYVKIKQSTQKTGEKIVAEDMSNPEKVENDLVDMLSSAISAIGQDTPFEAGTFLESIKRKVTSVFSPLADSIDGVSNTVDSELEVLPELKQVDEMIGTIQEVGSKIQEISDTAKPALEATAKAASAAAIQSCSMSQSATGKDFTFTTGSNYDLSTTTDSRQQLPYCKELNREHFLEPNCKVLVLAVGAGKQNLYVVDILS